MKRREALQRVAIMMGGAVSAPALISILEGCKSPIDTTTSDFILSKDQLALVSELAEIIIPKTDTPGAKDAEVGPFIQTMLKDCYSQEQGAHFLKGLGQVEEEAKKIGGNFMSLKPEQQIEVMKAMEKLAQEENNIEKAKVIDTETGLEKKDSKAAEAPTPFFNILKSLTLFGYFTSEPGATKALDYVPIPGKYEGCIPLKEGQKAYAL